MNLIFCIYVFFRLWKVCCVIGNLGEYVVVSTVVTALHHLAMRFDVICIKYRRFCTKVIFKRVVLSALMLRA